VELEEDRRSVLSDLHRSNGWPNISLYLDILFWSLLTNSTYYLAGVKNACSVNNGGCSHFCIPTPEGTHVCACPDASNRLPVQPADGRNCLSSNT